MHTPLSISQADHRPMYLQIMEQIRHLVAVGDWARGQEIPSIRALAADLRISVITIRRAYQELEAEGVIVTQQGRGTFVADRPTLGPDLRVQELDAHLRAAAELGQRLGLDAAAMDARFHEARRQVRRESSSDQRRT